MHSILFSFQIFITILITLFVISQKSNNDGMLGHTTGFQIPSKSQASFVSKFTTLLILIFLINSLLLARNSIVQHNSNQSLMKSLENESVNETKVSDDDNVPKME